MGTVHRIDDSLTNYYRQVVEAAEEIAASPLGSSAWFEPSWDIPEPGEQLADFFSATSLSLGVVGDYRGRLLHLLDLTGNPGTRTTKTFGSTIIVARAVRHTEVTGEPVLLITPSSANKAVGLRDAVLRAYHSGLTDPGRLRVVTVVPGNALPKLWASELDADPRLRQANPMALYTGGAPEEVKHVVTAVVDSLADTGFMLGGFRIWHSLAPGNYQHADVVRALFEHDVLPPSGTRERWHTHAVSSAYGFLGHDLGWRIVTRNDPRLTSTPKYLFVQHLETADLIQAITGKDITAEVRRLYRATGAGYLVKAADGDPRLPERCYSANERVERTFYTRKPATTSAVVDLVRDRGGDGMVVSLHECLDRYPLVRELLRRADFDRLPEDPRSLHEWATVMSVVGCLNAIDRDLIPEDAEVVIHASGAYSEGEFERIDRARLTEVTSPTDLRGVIEGAVSS